MTSFGQRKPQQRDEIVTGIKSCLVRLGRSTHFLSLEQRLALAEQCRDLADALDKGKIVGARITNPRPRRRLVQAMRRNGEMLYRLV